MSVRGIRVNSPSTSVFPWTACLVGLFCIESAVGQTLPTSTVSAGRKLAPSALHVIAPAMEYGETFQGPVDLPLLAENPDLAQSLNYDPRSETLAQMSKQVVFRGEVYCLEFAFKPVRMIEIDLPSKSGIERKNIWYLLYRVRYLGGDLKPVAEQDAFNNQVFATPQAVSVKWVRFMPTFRLVAKGQNRDYLDQVIPAVKKPIEIKERVGRPIYDSLQMQTLKIKKWTETEPNEVWGLATWVDVDPRIDFFTVQVQGLTNAQRLRQDGDQIRYLQKTLVLHFSRPGDTLNELEDRIRYGIPALEDPDRQKYILSQFGVKERLDHRWIYR